MDADLFHPGERRVQERTGERAKALINARHVTRLIPAAAREFIGQQRWCIVGAADEDGSVWAGLLTGEAGFVRASDDLASLRMTLDDPEGRLPDHRPVGSLQAGQSIAVLLIELEKRRRLRINGHVASLAPGSLDLDVGSAFPVCPRYIQKREPVAVSTEVGGLSHEPSCGLALVPRVVDWLGAADTLFIASSNPAGEVDVSHRGGRPGFVEVSGQRLRIPDFNGNSMFNTLGNLVLESRCGLALPDFDGSRQLQLTGRAQVRFDVAEGLERTGGTGRWIEFEVEAWRISPLNRPSRWRFVEASPFNP